MITLLLKSNKNNLIKYKYPCSNDDLIYKLSRLNDVSNFGFQMLVSFDRGTMFYFLRSFSRWAKLIWIAFIFNKRNYHLKILFCIYSY